MVFLEIWVHSRFKTLSTLVIATGCHEHWNPCVCKVYKHGYSLIWRPAFLKYWFDTCIAQARSSVLSCSVCRIMLYGVTGDKNWPGKPEGSPVQLNSVFFFHIFGFPYCLLRESTFNISDEISDIAPPLSHRIHIPIRLRCTVAAFRVRQYELPIGWPRAMFLQGRYQAVIRSRWLLVKDYNVRCFWTWAGSVNSILEVFFL